MNKIKIKCIITDKNNAITSVNYSDKSGLLGVITENSTDGKQSLINRIIKTGNRDNIECAIMNKHVIIVNDSYLRTDGNPDKHADLIELPSCLLSINEQNSWIESKEKEIKKEMIEDLRNRLKR